MKSFLKTTSAIALALCITVGSAFGSNPNGDSTKAKKEITVEESIMIDDLLAEFEKEESLNNLFADSEITFEVYDSKDQLVFTGNQKQWNDQKNTDLVSLKRKAEFLFDSDGTNIYKVF